MNEFYLVKTRLETLGGDFSIAHSFCIFISKPVLWRSQVSIYQTNE